MICPECKRPTKRLVYDRRGKRCPDCHSPNFLRMVDIVAPPPGFLELIGRMHDLAAGSQTIPRTADAPREISRMHEWLHGYVPPGYRQYKIP